MSKISKRDLMIFIAGLPDESVFIKQSVVATDENTPTFMFDDGDSFHSVTLTTIAILTPWDQQTQQDAVSQMTVEMKEQG